MIQSRRAFIKSCGILLAAAVAAPAFGTSMSSGAMQLGPAVNATLWRKQIHLIVPSGDAPFAKLVSGIVQEDGTNWWETPIGTGKELKDG